jgi:hypothetical protein
MSRVSEGLDVWGTESRMQGKYSEFPPQRVRDPRLVILGACQFEEFCGRRAANRLLGRGESLGR